MGAVKEARSRINALSGRKFCHWPGRPVRDNPQPGCPASRSIVKSLKNRKLKNIIDLHALNHIPQKSGEKKFHYFRSELGVCGCPGLAGGVPSFA